MGSSKTIISDGNKVILTGNIGRDAEVRFAPSGKAVVNLTMCANKTVNGEPAGHWQRCVGFGKLAETLGEWGKKGRKVWVEGYLKNRSYERLEDVKLEDGTMAKAHIKRHVTELVIQQFIFMDNKPGPATGDADEDDQGYNGDNTGNDEIPF